MAVSVSLVIINIVATLSVPVTAAVISLISVQVNKVIFNFFFCAYAVTTKVTRKVTIREMTSFMFLLNVALRTSKR